MHYRVMAESLLAVTLTASLAIGAPSARDTLQQFLGRASAILKETADPNETRDKLRELAHGMFDGPNAARRALGPEWEQLTITEREQYTHMFLNALERAYFDILDARLPHDWLAAARFTGEDATGNRVAVVGTTIRAKDQGDVRVDYIMVRSHDTWLIHDIVIDDVSLVEDYGAHYADTLRTAATSAR